MAKFVWMILKGILYPFALFGALLLFAFDKVDAKVKRT